MEYRRLGRSGLVVSRVCLGSASFGARTAQPWRTDAATASSLVRAAFDRGINFFDTGPTYGGGEAESILGLAIRETAPRDAYVLASKVYFPTGPGPNDRGLSRKHILASVDASLARLNVDYLDLLHIHRWDAGTPLEETLRTLDGLVRAGKVRYLGASSMSAWRFMKALSMQRALGLEPFVCMQNYYNLMYREEEREMLPLCVEEGVGVTPWSPLARGLLAGAAADAARLQGDRFAYERYDAGVDDPVIERLNALATARGEVPAQIALAWLLSKPAVVAPVLGFSDVRQIDLACSALTLELTRTEIAALEEPYRPHPVIGFEPEIARD